MGPSSSIRTISHYSYCLFDYCLGWLLLVRLFRPFRLQALTTHSVVTLLFSRIWNIGNGYGQLWPFGLLIASFVWYVWYIATCMLK